MANKSEQDLIFMRRCLQLAALGAPYAAPNPMVGAVIVHEGRIIGEGWHHRAGCPHAEPNAIRSVSKQELLKESTLYVSLEPCSHYGKTPPCADLIIEKQIPQVVVGCLDPFPKVSGRGIEKMRAAGIDVRVGVCEDECRRLNRRFFHFQLHRRPYVCLKWAQTADGFIDRIRHDGSSDRALAISDDWNRMLVHRERSLYDAVLVGSRTALADRPQLTVRDWPSDRQPRRFVFSRDFSNKDINCLTHNGLETIQADSLEALLDRLGEMGIQSLLVEGGARLHQAFLNQGLWNELRIETSPLKIGEGLPAPTLLSTEDCLEHQRTDSAGHLTKVYIRNF